jgi:hypothetical protein
MLKQLGMEWDLTLKGKHEFYPGLNRKTYRVLKVDTVEKQIQMEIIFEKFIQNQHLHSDEKHFIGIDYEFNKVRKDTRDVALMQISLENDSDSAWIFVLYPPELIKQVHAKLIQLITLKPIYKILHGAESLDIPYMFSQLLIDRELIKNFCINFYDTRFLCDYYHINNNLSGRCSIYWLLLEHKIITGSKINELEAIEKKMGPIYLINIQIHKLNHWVLKYSMYDVLFLPELMRKFLKMGWAYTNLIPEFTSIINQYKRAPFLKHTDYTDYTDQAMQINPLAHLEHIVNQMNLYYILSNKLVFNNLWEMYFYTLGPNYLLELHQISYFKKITEVISKWVLYQILLASFPTSNKSFKKFPYESFHWTWFKQYSSVYKILCDFQSKLLIEIQNMNNFNLRK